MEQKKKETCSACQGKKIIEGVCECNTEWRGNQNDNEWEDCQCTPDQECPECQGKGYIELKE